MLSLSIPGPAAKLGFASALEELTQSPSHRREGPPCSQFARTEIAHRQTSVGCLKATEAPPIFAAPSLHPPPTGTTCPGASHPRTRRRGAPTALQNCCCSSHPPRGRKDEPRNTRVLLKDAAPWRPDPTLASDGNLELFHLFVQHCGIFCIPPACRGSGEGDKLVT